MILLPLTVVKQCSKKEPKEFMNLSGPPSAFCGNYSLAILIFCLKAKQNHELQRAESGKEKTFVVVKKIWNSFDSFYALKLSDFPDSCKPMPDVGCYKGAVYCAIYHSAVNKIVSLS